MGDSVSANYDDGATGTLACFHDDDEETRAPFEVSEMYYDPRTGNLIIHGGWRHDGAGYELKIPVKASGSWNEFVASLPLWTEQNDVTGEVDNDGDSDDGDNAPRRVQYQEAKDQLMEKGFLTGGDAQRAIKALEKINAISVKQENR